LWKHYLAIEVLELNDALQGPSENFHSYGHVINSNGRQLWDDDLTQDECDLISGVYKIYTGVSF